MTVGCLERQWLIRCLDQSVSLRLCQIHRITGRVQNQFCSGNLAISIGDAFIENFSLFDIHTVFIGLLHVPDVTALRCWGVDFPDIDLCGIIFHRYLFDFLGFPNRNGFWHGFYISGTFWNGKLL